ncbi:hypothetical protein HDE_07254 [Halotydeus destructor]|nr:hypothetical protein HDE_07254 [Halotydeus destructor]
MFQAIPSKNVNSKGLLASRIGSLFKSGPLAKHELFKPVELAALESNMKSDFVNNLWFFKLMSAVMDEGKSITMKKKRCMTLQSGISREEISILVKNARSLKTS